MKIRGKFVQNAFKIYKKEKLLGVKVLKKYIFSSF